MTERKNHIGYILLSYGAKHTRLPLAERPGASSQIDRIKHFVTQIGRPGLIWRHDHVIVPKGPSSFLNLFAILARMKEHAPNALIFVDDTARLLRNLPPDAHDEMLDALKPFHQYIIDVRRRKQLSKLKHPEWVALLLSATGRVAPDAPTGRKRERTGSKTTNSARRVSELSLGRAADHRARLIGELRDELSQAGADPSYVELARVANEKGLRTSRGNFLYDVAVARAIRRITKLEDDA